MYCFTESETADFVHYYQLGQFYKPLVDSLGQQVVFLKADNKLLREMVSDFGDLILLHSVERDTLQNQYDNLRSLMLKNSVADAEQVKYINTLEKQNLKSKKQKRRRLLTAIIVPIATAWGGWLVGKTFK